jgi:hypothetical protein
MPKLLIFVNTYVQVILSDFKLSIFDQKEMSTESEFFFSSKFDFMICQQVDLSDEI